MTPIELQTLFGGIDIYLLDQILRGRISPGLRILDAGCGCGRNLTYFLRAGFDVAGVDQDSAAIAEVTSLARALASGLDPANFRAEPIEAMSFGAERFDVVISSAVLHFARDPAHFRAMLDGGWLALRVGGLFFCRLASTIGMPGRFRPLGEGRFLLPDGSRRFLVDQARLLELSEELGGQLLDPIKTTVVQDQRAMTTWVLRKTIRRTPRSGPFPADGALA